MQLKVPHSRARLNIPLVESESKEILTQQSMDMLEGFLQQECQYMPGHCVSFKEFYKRFSTWCDDSELHYWTKPKVSKKLPVRHPTGGHTKFHNQSFVGNLSFKDQDVIPTNERYINQDGKLILVKGACNGTNG